MEFRLLLFFSLFFSLFFFFPIGGSPRDVELLHLDCLQAGQKHFKHQLVGPLKIALRPPQRLSTILAHNQQIKATAESKLFVHIIDTSQLFAQFTNTQEIILHGITIVKAYSLFIVFNCSNKKTAPVIDKEAAGATQLRLKRKQEVDFPRCFRKEQKRLPVEHDCGYC